MRGWREPVRSYDPRPLLVYLSEHSHVEIAAILDVHVNTVACWSTDKRGLKPWQADVYAIRAGTHPSHLWPEWFANAQPEEEAS